VHYSVRVSRFSPLRTFRLTAGALVVQSSNGTTDEVPYEEISGVRLQCSGLNRYRCVIATERRRWTLSNRHFLRVGEYEEFNTQYGEFLTQLHRRLRPFQSHVRFARAGNGLPILGMVLFLLLPVVYVAGLLLFSPPAGSQSWDVLLAVLLAPVSLSATLLLLFRQRRLTTYSPTQLPVQCIPA